MPFSTFPDPSTLMELDKKTFSLLQCDPIFGRESVLQGHACTAFSSISSNKGYSFDSSFDANIEDRKNRRVYVASRVICNKHIYKEISHCFAICECGVTPKLLRKVHFDITFSDPSSGDLHPVYHFQLDGSLTKKMENDGYDDSELTSAISVPRWPYQPISAALFFDVVFRELGNQDLRDFIATPGWKKRVAENEKKILVPYYEFAVQHINSASKTPFVDKLYGIT